MRYPAIWLLCLLVVVGCVPKEPVVLRGIENIELAPGSGADPILKADARFYNPNQIRMKLKYIRVEVFIDGKKSALVDQQLKSTIKSKSEFSVPLEVQLSLKEIGLVDALLSLLGGKKYELHYRGYIHGSVKGLPVKIPIDYKREVKLRI